MIHKYKMNGINIAMDVNGGSVHVIDDITYDLLDYYEDFKNKTLDESELYIKMNDYSIEDIKTTIGEVDELVE